MATIENEYYLRSVLLLLDGGSYIAKRIISRELPGNGGSLDALLKQERFKKKIKQEFQNKEQLGKLYPSFGDTDVNTWDIQMLINTMLILFQSDLKTEEKHRLRNIRRLRHDLAHSPNASLQRTKYEDFTEDLSIAITYLASECEENVQTKCADIFEKYKSCPLDVKSSIEQIKEMRDNDDMFVKIFEEFEKNRTQFSDEISDATSQICQTVYDKSQETNNEIADVKQAVCSGMQKFQADLEDLKRMLRKEPFKRIRSIVNSRLKFSGDDEGIVDLADKIVLRVINAAIKKAKGATDMEEVRKAVDDILEELDKIEGVTVLAAEPECIIVKIQCDTYKCLYDVLMYITSPVYHQRLNAIAEACCSYLETSKPLMLHSDISEECLQNIIDGIGRSENIKQSSIVLPVQCETIEGVEKVVTLFESDILSNKFQKLSEALSKQLKGSVSVKAAVHKINLKEEKDSMSELQRLHVFRKPQKFISFKGPDLEVNENVLSELRGLHHHLVVVTIIGSYRTGKSWILNQLADCSVQDGFGVADDHSPVTSGIWILCRQHPEKENCVIVFLDTAGLHDPFKGDAANDDSRLFIVSFLLSDTFIYNVKEKISDHDLEKIGFITKICKDLLGPEARKTFPEFIFLLRDVAKLELDKKPVKPIEYLENVLASGDQSNADLSPKKCIKQLCVKRTCFTLTQPTDFEILEELGETEQPELKPKFLDEFGRLKEHIIKFADIKRVMSGSPYTISAFCEFVLEIVAAVSSNKIPRIESLQQRIAHRENERLWEQTTGEFKRQLRDKTKIDQYESFKEMYSTLERNGLKQLHMQLIPLSEDSLHETVEKFKSFAENEFRSFSKELCLDILEGHLQPLFDKVKDKAYTSPGAKKRFQGDLERVKGIYEMKKNLGPEKANVWMEKENEMDTRMKELELQDLQNELQTTSEENKQERERIDQNLNEVKQELEEEKRKMEMKEREFEQKQRELEQECKQEVKKQQKVSAETQKALDKLLEEKKSNADDANFKIAAIAGLTAIMTAAFTVLSKKT